MTREDLYTRWLGIPKGKRPPDHYTLLGLPRLCRDKDIINRAVQTQLERLDPYQIHRDRDTREACVRIRNEIAQAGVVLLDPKRRTLYERQFFGDVAAHTALGKPASQDVPGGADETEDPWDDTSTETSRTYDWIEVELARSERLLGRPSDVEGLTLPEQPEAIADGRSHAVRSARPRRWAPIAIAAILMAISAFAFHRAMWPSAGSEHVDEALEPSEKQLRGLQDAPGRPDEDTIAALCAVAVQEPGSDRGREAQKRLARLSNTDLLRELWTVVFEKKYSSLSPVLLTALQAKCEHLRADAGAVPGQSFRAADVDALMQGFRSILLSRNRGPVRKLLLDILRTKCEGLSRDRAIALVTNQFAGISGQERTGLLKELLTGPGTIYLSNNAFGRFDQVEPGDFVLACLQSERAAPEFRATVPGILGDLWAVLDEHLEGAYRQPLATYALESLDVTATLEFAAIWPADVDFDRISDLLFESLVSDDAVVQAAAEAAFEALLNHLTGERLTRWIGRLRDSEDARHREISRVALAKADRKDLKDLIPSFFRSEEAEDREIARRSLLRTDPNHLGDVIDLFLDSAEPADHAVARAALSNVEKEQPLARLIPGFLASPDPNDRQVGMGQLGELRRAVRREVLRNVFTASHNDSELQKRILNDATGTVVTDVAMAILESPPAPSEEEASLRTRAFFIVAGASTQDDEARSSAERYIRTLPTERFASLLELMTAGGVHPGLVKAIVRRMDQNRTGESSPRLDLFRALPGLPDDVLATVLSFIDTGGEQEMVSTGLSGLHEGDGGLGKPRDKNEFGQLVRNLGEIIGRSTHTEAVRIQAILVLSNCNQTRDENLAQKMLDTAYRREVNRLEDSRNERLLEELKKHYTGLRREPQDMPYLPRDRSRTPRTRRPGGQ